MLESLKKDVCEIAKEHRKMGCVNTNQGIFRQEIKKQGM